MGTIGFDTVWILLGNGDGTFQEAQRLDNQIGHDSLAVGDFDGDGLRDLAVTHFDPNHVSVLLGNGDGTF